MEARKAKKADAFKDTTLLEPDPDLFSEMINERMQVVRDAGRERGSGRTAQAIWPPKFNSRNRDMWKQYDAEKMYQNIYHKHFEKCPRYERIDPSWYAGVDANGIPPRLDIGEAAQW